MTKRKSPIVEPQQKTIFERKMAVTETANCSWCGTIHDGGPENCPNEGVYINLTKSEMAKMIQDGRSTDGHRAYTVQVDSFDSPESSLIASAEFHYTEEGQPGTLYVQLRRKGTVGDPLVYRYPNVPWNIWVTFLGHESKGRYFNEWIRTSFDGEQITEVRS